MFASDELERIAAKGRGGLWGPLARAVTQVENSQPWEVSLPRAPQPCHIIGVTGPPGAGKSTLTGRLIESFADAGQRVAVLAIDPSSPLTGGAVLGDRLRMETHLHGRPEVFVRSLASRGSHGAVAGSTRNVARLLELSGLFDVVIVETVGAGQTEVAIVEVADTVLLVTVPGLGDAVQAIKAGLMEVADAFVVNMADRPGAQETVRHLRLAAGRSGDVFQTVALDGTGVPELREGLTKRWVGLHERAELNAMRQAKWASDAGLIAQAWVADCFDSDALDPHSTVLAAVSQILKEATARWEHQWSK